MASYWNSWLGTADEKASLSTAHLSPEDAACVADWGLTLAEEAVLVCQLRGEIEMELEERLESMWDDYVLRRFLRARKHDIIKAKDMFIAQLKWRKENDVESAMEYEFPEKDQFHMYYPEGFYGVDRSGRPVYLQLPGRIDTDALWKFTTLDRAIRYHIKQQERYWRVIAPAASVAAGTKLESSLVLIDMDGVGISTITGEVRKIMGLIMQIDQDYYPELMHRCLIINAPTTFRIIWGMVKYLLDARTQAKIEVLPSDFKEELLKYIAPEQLAVQYGGSCTEPLMAEPGPWRDPEILKRVQQQREQVSLLDAVKQLSVDENDASNPEGSSKAVAEQKQQPVAVAAEAAA